MERDIIFLPVLVQIILTVVLYIYLAIAKSQAIRLGQVNEVRRSLYDDAWPEKVLQINNCIRNQFEVPVLFYVLAVVLWGINEINVYIHVIAWLFVFSRIMHAFIHTGLNNVPIRRKVFMFGCLLVVILSLFAGRSILVS